MKKLQSLIVRLVREEDGAAAAEYAILVAGVAAAVAAGVTAFDLDGIFTTIGTQVADYVANAAP